ncbi:MAG: UDP-3-O-(3-hydroxymyristoyl)glucosamine N-acyltransferase, partial [Calditrichia bacterium]
TIEGVAPVEKAGKRELTFIANPKYRQHLDKSNTGAVIIDEKAGIVPHIPYIKVKDAYFAFLQAVLLFNPPRMLIPPGVHSSAVVHESVKIGYGVAVGANCYIAENVTVGDNTQIFPNCVVLNGTEIGESCILYPSVTIREDCKVGNKVIIHNGAVIGSDGFGFAPHEGRYHKIPQAGCVVIEDDVEIGANTTIDRATMGETRVKRGVKLDNLVHLAHNVVIGEDTVIAAQTGVSGSTTVGSHVVMGGQVGIVGHIHIGDNVQIGAQSGVRKSIGDGEIYFGSPARPIIKTKKIEAVLNNLPELLKRIRRLEKEVENLKNG